MSLHHLGETRSRRAHNHLLQTPDTFVWAPLPGMTHTTACVHAAPALGAGFAMYTALLEPSGKLGLTPHSRFVYVLDGTAITPDGKQHPAGSFCFFPPSSDHRMNSSSGARLLVIEKPYVERFNDEPPRLSGLESEVGGSALLGDDAVWVRSLLPPDDPRFDFAVNTMEYQPGASLSMVESHVMEHGLLMLEGEGIYRLGESWYPVAKGDFIWMGPFCPQWFGALGKRPARYLIYKNWNRHPLHGVAPE